MAVMDKGKEWLKNQNWRAILTSPAGLAVVTAIMWSISHRSGILQKLNGTPQHETEDGSGHYSWHLRESILLACIVAASLFFYKRKLVSASPNLEKFDDPPIGSKWMIVPENASIMLPGQDYTVNAPAFSPYGDQTSPNFIRGPAPF